MTYRYYVGPEPIIVDGETSDYADTTYGSSITFDFYIQQGSLTYDDFATGATYGGETGGTYGEETGFTYGSDVPEVVTAKDRYNRLKDYLNYAGYAETGQTIGSVYFEEKTDFANSPVDTLVIPIYPFPDIDEAPGVWGVIEAGDDTTEIFGSIARVSVDVFVLAEYSEFDTEAEVRNEFEVFP